MIQSEFQNKLVRLMTPQDFVAIAKNLEMVELANRQILVQRNALVPYIYFPESGQASVLAKIPSRNPIEVAMIGREGMTDLAHPRKVSLETMVQVEGHGHRIERDVFLSHLRKSPGLSDLLERWQHVLLMQTSYAALSHGSCTVVERLARYLLMLHDRLDGDELNLPHEYFAWMLAVRRAGVTAAMGELRDRGAVEAKRSLVCILSREVLRAIAAGSYGPAEAEYEQVFGTPLARDIPHQAQSAKS